MKKVIEATYLSKIFPPHTVLQDVSLDLFEGEAVAIMGKSGEGKSTLLHILGTLEAPTKGAIRICNQSPSPQNITHIRNKNIGFIFQDYHLLEDFSVLENVLMPLKIARKESKFWIHAERLIKEVGLESKMHTLIKFLSGGEKQRVVIARALSNEPEIILADEPTGNLDEELSREIEWLLLETVKKYNKALLVVTHDEEFAKLCDRILLLKAGHLYTHPQVCKLV